MISERCVKDDYMDPSLNQWQSLPMSYNMSESEPQVKVTRFYNHIYCYLLNVTLNGHSQYCPPSVFKLHVDVSFSTGNLDIEAITLELNITMKDLVLDSVHFNEFDIQSMNERRLIENQNNLTEQVKRLKNLNSEIVIANEHSYPWPWILLSFSLYTALISLVWCYFHSITCRDEAMVEPIEMRSTNNCHVCALRKQKKVEHDRSSTSGTTIVKQTQGTT